MDNSGWKLRSTQLKILLLVLLTGWSVSLNALDREEKAVVRAIRAGDLIYLKSWLEKHPDPNCPFSNGKSGLYYAIEADRREIGEFLLRSGADPDREAGDISLLNWAVRFDRERMARLLIEYGAQVDKTDRFMNTPLIYAALLNRPGMCKILIDRGADPLHQNRKGRTAAYYVRSHKGSLLYEYLLQMEYYRLSGDPANSMRDGPYVFREGGDHLVMMYFEYRQEDKLTRLTEKTSLADPSGTTLEGAGWDSGSYTVLNHYTPNPYESHIEADIFAVGDIHGRYDALVNLLKNNGVIGEDMDWNFGEGHLVMLGDVFDRGDQVTEVLWLLHRLQRQAMHAGGNVHLLLGNHEVMALTGDHRYLNEKYNYFTRYFQTGYFRLFDTSAVLGQWLRSQNAIVRINDHLFSHAGISPQFVIFNISPIEVNDRIRKYLHMDFKISEGTPESMILGAFGPLWYRGYMHAGEKAPEVNQAFVNAYLDANGLKRMITAHNEQATISSSFQGRVVFTDVHIDESGKTAQGLLISNDQLFRCLADGRREPME